MNFEFKLYDALVSIDVPAEKARAVIDALEHDMGSTLATKQDLLLLKQDLKPDILLVKQDLKQDILFVRQEIQLVKQELEHRIDGIARGLARLEEKVTRELELLRSSMTVRMGSMLAVAVGLLFAALKLT